MSKHARPRPRAPHLLLVVGVVAATVPFLAPNPAGAATFTVTNTNDAGPGSLRQAITDAELNAGADIINITATGTVPLATPLPGINEPVTINGPAHSWPTPPQFELDGSAMVGLPQQGLGVAASASPTVIRNLSIVNIGSNDIDAAGTVELYGNRLTSTNGTWIRADNSIVGGTGTDEGNKWVGGRGMHIEGDNVTVYNNTFGLDLAGTAAAQTYRAITISGADGTIVGGPGPGERNVCGDTSASGGWCLSNGGSDTTVQGNYFGTTINGNATVSNDDSVQSSGANLLFGGTGAGEGNLIAFGDEGLRITGGAAQIYGNIIGSDPTGMVDQGGVEGVIVDGGTVILGGSSPGMSNQISGNATGVSISGGNVTIQGNNIGLNANSSAVLAGNNGIDVSGGTVLIGGTNAGERNVINTGGSAASFGIRILNQTGAQIFGNYIGVDPLGTTQFPRNRRGILVDSSADVVIGDGTSAGRNIIAASQQEGIRLISATNTQISDNYIGTDVTGTVNFGNTLAGIRTETSTGTQINSNLISANANGIEDLGSDTVIIESNLIGTDSSGLVALPNNNGIVLADSLNITVGGSTSATNVISGNTNNGISVSNSVGSTTGLVILSNFIGVGIDGTTSIPNGEVGIGVVGVTDGVQIGSTSVGDANFIHNNGGSGIEFNGSSGNFARGNSIFNNDSYGIELIGPLVPAPAPDLTEVQTTGVTVAAFTITGSLTGASPNTTFDIDVYGSPACDNTGEGEGLVWLATFQVTTDGSGSVSFTSPSIPDPDPNTQIAVTASTTGAGTSEFSVCQAVQPPPTPTTVPYSGSTTVPGAEAGSNQTGNSVSSGLSATGIHTGMALTYSFCIVVGGIALVVAQRRARAGLKRSRHTA